MACHLRRVMAWEPASCVTPTPTRASGLHNTGKDKNSPFVSYGRSGSQASPVGWKKFQLKQRRCARLDTWVTEIIAGVP